MCYNHFMDDMPEMSIAMGALAAYFAFIGLAMQFFGFFMIEPAGIGVIIGWASLVPYFMAAIYYLSYSSGEKYSIRNTALIFLAGLLVCALCYRINPGIRPSVKSFFERTGINLATGYEPRSHRRGNR